MDWTLFVTKKLVSSIFCPTMTALLLWLMGIVLWRRRPNSPLGAGCIAAGGIVLLVASLGVTSFFLVNALEREAGPPADPADLARRGIRHIVVLGGGVRHGSANLPSLPASDSLARVVEGVRLWKGIPGARLVLSGGKYFNEAVTTAEAMAWAAKLLKVPNEALIMESASWDTDDEAVHVKRLVGREPFALVTSAIHMKRALLTFRMRGLNPVPAPADFLGPSLRLDLALYIPNSRNVMSTRIALHEYAGLLWLRAKAVVLGRIHRWENSDERSSDLSAAPDPVHGGERISQRLPGLLPVR